MPGRALRVLRRVVFLYFSAFLAASAAWAGERSGSWGGLFDGNAAGTRVAYSFSAVSPAALHLDFSPSVAARRLGAAPAAGSASAPASFYFTGQGTDISSVLASAIDSSRRSILAALYELDLPNVGEALIRAQKRGLDVHILMDYSYTFQGRSGNQKSDSGGVSTQVLSDLIKNGVDIRVLRGRGAYGIMHNKFAVFDNGLLETGSYNWSVLSNSQDYNNVVFRSEPHLAAAFTEYWKWMWSQAQTLADAQNGPAIPSSEARPPKDPQDPLSFHGYNWKMEGFSPKGGAASSVVLSIDNSQSSIDIAMFVLTSNYITSALTDALKRGVKVRVVLDKSEMPYSAPNAKILLDAGASVRVGSGIGGKGVMHDKFGVFDLAMVETGSFNWSNNATYNNFENIVFGTDSAQVKGFEKEFQFLYGQAHAPTADDLDATPHDTQGSTEKGVLRGIKVSLCRY